MCKSYATRNQENKLKEHIIFINDLIDEINKKYTNKKSLIEIKKSDKFYKAISDMMNLEYDTRIPYITYKHNMEYLHKNIKELNFILNC